MTEVIKVIDKQVAGCFLLLYLFTFFLSFIPLHFSSSFFFSHSFHSYFLHVNILSVIILSLSDIKLLTAFRSIWF